MKYLSKGKRGVVYATLYKGKEVVVKVKREGSSAIRALENEALWLGRLNKRNIGPRLYGMEGGKLFMEWIKGPLFVEWRKTASERKVNDAIRKIFSQCRVMDEMRVNKLEMHSPLKHILMRDDDPVLIDFERCKQTLKPKNVTQFCQFLAGLGMCRDEARLRKLLAEYKKEYGAECFKRIVLLFSSS